RLVELPREDGNGHVAAAPPPSPALAPVQEQTQPPAESPPAAAPAPDETRLAARAAAMALGTAFRTHGHPAAHLGPPGGEPARDPVLPPGWGAGLPGESHVRGSSPPRHPAGARPPYQAHLLEALGSATRLRAPEGHNAAGAAISWGPCAATTKWCVRGRLAIR